MVETAVQETSGGEASETQWGGNLLAFAQPYLNGNPQAVVAVDPEPERPQVAYTIQAKLSHYTPWAGGTNCFRFVYGQCVSPMASGKPWQDYVDEAVACPREFPFGTQFVIFDKIWTCWDRGGKIVKNWDGTYWLDLLTAAPPVPFGTVVEVGVIPPQ